VEVVKRSCHLQDNSKVKCRSSTGLPDIKQGHYLILAILERDDELAILEDGHSSAKLDILFGCNVHLSHRMRMTGISRAGTIIQFARVGL